MADIWGTHTEMVMVTSQCIDECLKCHRLCGDTVTQCLLIGGAYARPELIRLLWDCAQICQTTADFMLRKSSFQLQASNLCIDICTQVTEVLAEFEDDRMMRVCIISNQRCAAICREMTADAV